MRIYLAGQFPRQAELRGYKAELEDLGFTVTSRWLTEAHDWIGPANEPLPIEVGARFAREDLEDIDGSDVLVVFTEQPKSGLYTGGRHVEAGYALAKGMPILTVGPAENVFYCLVPEFWRATTWIGARAKLEAVADATSVIHVPAWASTQ